MKDNVITAKGWIRPQGAPRVWRVIDGQMKLDDGTTKALRLSIQEVPQDRRQEAIDFMIRYFIPDEPMCKCLDLKDDPNLIHDLSVTWTYCLDQGIVEAAYVLDSNGKITELAAVNMLWVVTEETEKEAEQLQKVYQSAEGMKIMQVLGLLSKKADARKVYGVDKYIGAFGLSVSHKHRGQKLGLHMLEARRDIGKKYGIPATSTIFTARSSQILAERAGFETMHVQNYADITDDDGKPFFPGIEPKDMRLMMKKL